MSLCAQSTEHSSFGFWRPRRPLRAIDPVTRCRPKRLRTSAIVNRPLDLTVKLEVEKFKIYGTLRPTRTSVHNSLPSFDTIQTEKTLMSFEEKRHTAPENALYGSFYRSLTSCITPLPSRPNTWRSARVSSRGPETPKTTTFTLFPHLPSQETRPQRSSQSVVSRIVTSYGREPSEGQISLLRPGGMESSCASVLSSREESREFSRFESEPNSQRCVDTAEEQFRSPFSSRV